MNSRESVLSIVVACAIAHAVEERLRLPMDRLEG